MTKKIKSTYDKFVESLNPEEKAELEKDYKNLLISEMLIAAKIEKNIYSLSTTTKQKAAKLVASP